MEAGHADACPGPAGGVLRPRTSDGPWVPLRRAAEAWREAWGYPRREVWAPIEATLHDLQRGPLSGLRWSLVLVADVASGRLDPTFRVDVFHGHREGHVVPGQAMLQRLTTLDARVREVLAPAAQTCPVHPAMSDGPGGAKLGAYVDTGHLTPEGAWTILGAGLAAGSIPLHEPAPLGVTVLGYAVAPSGHGPVVDVYLTLPTAPVVPTETATALTPPEEVVALAEGGPCVATLRLHEGRLAVRKWDVSWWSTGQDDVALLETLGARGEDRDALERWLHDPRYGLHPTTLGWRESGRRIYLRVC